MPTHPVHLSYTPQLRIIKNGPSASEIWIIDFGAPVNLPNAIFNASWKPVEMLEHQLRTTMRRYVLDIPLRQVEDEEFQFYLDGSRARSHMKVKNSQEMYDSLVLVSQQLLADLYFHALDTAQETARIDIEIDELNNSIDALRSFATNKDNALANAINSLRNTVDAMNGRTQGDYTRLTDWLQLHQARINSINRRENEATLVYWQPSPRPTTRPQRFSAWLMGLFGYHPDPQLCEEQEEVFLAMFHMNRHRALQMIDHHPGLRRFLTDPTGNLRFKTVALDNTEQDW